MGVSKGGVRRHGERAYEKACREGKVEKHGKASEEGGGEAHAKSGFVWYHQFALADARREEVHVAAGMGGLA
eukprot:5366527-Pleurochrysis_carterae.AAC.2